MTIQRHFAPISGRFEPESLAGFAGIYSLFADNPLTSSYRTYNYVPTSAAFHRIASTASHLFLIPAATHSLAT